MLTSNAPFQSSHQPSIHCSPEPESEEESSEESSSDDDSDEEEQLPSPTGRGKQLRPVGRGKQLRAPSPPPAPPAAAAPQKDETDSSTSAYKPAPSSVGAVARGGGKNFRGMGKQLASQA